MNLKQARYIQTIAQEGSITAAARKLYISQPSLSQMLKQVEVELGTALFDRSVSPVHLTLAGEACLQAAEAILAAWSASFRRSGTRAGDGSGWGSAFSGGCRCSPWPCPGFWPGSPMWRWRSPSGAAPTWRSWC